MWHKVRFAVLTWLDSWSPLQRFERWRDQRLGRRVDERPDSFHWVGGIPQRRKDLILGRLQGHYDYGDGRKKEDPNYMIFSSRNCNFPQPKYLTWWLTQFRRWGMVTGAPDYAGVAKQVMRPDIYEEAMKEIGFKHGGSSVEPETLFDGVKFDPANPEEYAAAFAVKNLKG